MGVLDALLTLDKEDGRICGVVNAIVTSNKDPEGLGRVKLKFPWLSEDDESDWARVAMPMTGKDMGMFFLPEVDDEVLVAFDQGIVDRPYVLGSLWNGIDKPPAQNRDGKNNVRFIKSRSGHLIQLDDSKGDERIAIIDKSGKNNIIIKTSDNTITITTEDKLSIKAKGDISLDSNSGKIILSGNGVEIRSKSSVEVEASSSMDLKASAQLTIKGQMVNIN